MVEFCEAEMRGCVRSVAQGGHQKLLAPFLPFLALLWAELAPGSRLSQNHGAMQTGWPAACPPPQQGHSLGSPRELISHFPPLNTEAHFLLSEALGS